ncbi:MAG: DUF1850 domain-containing protein [Syntrophobacter sp.]
MDRCPAQLCGSGDFLMKPKALILGGIALALLVAWGWPLRILVLRDVRDGCRVFAHVVSPGDTFSLRYTHSVKQKPVWDFYRIDAHYRIMQTQTIFPDSDFGLPSLAVGTEIYTLLPDGNGCISGMRRLIPSLQLRVERAYNNILTFGEATSVNLSQKCGDSILEMRIQNMNLIQYAFRAMKFYGE